MRPSLPLTGPQVYYRYDCHHYEYHSQIMAQELMVIRVTPSGVWVNDYGRKRFVLNGAKKKFAHPTKELALASFIARKERQITILTAQFERITNALKAAQAHNPNQAPLLIEYDNPTFVFD